MSQENETTKKRFFAYFDIMGFKDMMMKHDHDYGVNKVTIAKKLRQTLIDGTKEGFRIKTTLKSAQFSDSIFIFSTSDTLEDLLSIFQQTRFFLKMCFRQQIPIKGAISHGLITADFENSIFVGQPIIDAYLIHEELNMYGTIIDHNVETKLKEFEKEKDYIDLLKSLIIKYATPTKHGKINYYCIYWPAFSFPQIGAPSGYSFDLTDKRSIENFYLSVSGKPRLYVDNTMGFIDYLIDLEKEKYPGIEEFIFKGV